MKAKISDQARLIKRYHTLAAKLKLTNENKADLLASFGVTSSRELSSASLEEVCNLLSYQLNSDMDKWRKRVLAAIYGYLQLTGRAANPEYVKAIAVRSAGDYGRFNQIPLGRLQTVYYFFLDKQKTLKHAGSLVNEDLDVMQLKN